MSTPRRTFNDPKRLWTSWISRKAISARRSHARLIPLEQAIDKAGLRNGDEHEEDGDDRHRRQIEGVGGDHARLVEAIDDTNDLDECRILLQSDEIIEQRRHDSAHCL